jgi:anti-anti-sigma factor
VIRAVHASRPLVIQVQQGEESVVRLGGALDVTTADEFQRTIEDLVTRHAGDILLDLSNLGFSDVAGVRESPSGPGRRR